MASRKTIGTSAALDGKTITTMHHKIVQHGASKKNRFRQAEVAFEAKKKIRGGTYLLVDDVLTTGASAHHVAKALREAGADDVWLAVVARQPLD